jgi:protein-S-isoprenylcysteine O-methyltransferase Ste14
MSVLKWVYPYRNYLVSPALIFTMICFRWEEEGWFVWSLGISLLLFGIFLRIWAQQHLHYRLKVHKTLTITGPYSFVRNPMYLGNILICLGTTVISELLWFVPITFLYCLGIYSLVVRYEEAHLLEKYGESYCKYKAEIPRWLPKVPRFKPIVLINEYFYQSIVIESASLLLLLPYILKEIIEK